MSAKLNYQPGEIIFQQGYPGDYAYIIVSGEVEIIDLKPDGAVEMIALLEPGQMFGEMALLDDKPRSATARARTAVALQIMPI